jgi:hypothetical protein
VRAGARTSKFVLLPVVTCVHGLWSCLWFMCIPVVRGRTGGPWSCPWFNLLCMDVVRARTVVESLFIE